MPAASSIRPSPSSAWIPIRPSTFPTTTAWRFLDTYARLCHHMATDHRIREPPPIQYRPTEPTSRAGTAVHGGRAAQADHHQRGTALGCLPDEFAHASRRCAQRIQLVGAEQRDAARGGALEYRGLSIHPAELAAYRDAEWTGDRDLLAEGPRCEHDVQQAIAPVGDRALEQRGPRKGPADPGGQRVRDLARAERAFECRWSHEDYRLHSALCIDSCILREHKMSR